MIIGEEKRKILIIALSSAALLALDIFFILRPICNKCADLKTQIVSVKNNINSLNQQISSMDNIKRQLEALRQEQSDYEKKFPKEEEIPALFDSLSNIALKSGVAIIAIKPSHPAQEAVFHEIPMEISAKGGYHQIGQFINKLETSDRFIEVKDIEIKQDNTTPRRHSLKLLVSTYILGK